MIFTTVPLAIINLFILITLFTYYWLVKQLHASKRIATLVAIWLVLQAILGQTGFYEVNNTTPPRFILMIMPPMLFIIILFNTKKGKAYIDSLNIEKLTLLHIVRIPVEMVLFALFTVKLVPQLMTFEGANFDIFSGLSAILVYFLMLNKDKATKKMLIIWNVVCLILLLVIVAIAILSAQTPFQQLAFEQPNIGVLYFPFNWLPSFIVPVVLFGHMAALRKLLFQHLN
jgi:uncharacterized membrane protein